MWILEKLWTSVIALVSSAQCDIIGIVATLDLFFSRIFYLKFLW